MTTERVAVIGTGPAALMAAEVITGAGLGVDIYEAMPSAGRKVLMAGKSGLNISHTGSQKDFAAQYQDHDGRLRGCLKAFGPEAVVQWMDGLGMPAHTGPTGRIFPQSMKASPLLRAWLRRLQGRGARLHLKHRWAGWDAWGALVFTAPEGQVVIRPAATVFALGGGSWRRLGSDGEWTAPFAEAGIPVTRFRPSNCGFLVDWSDRMRDAFAGAPVKGVRLSAAGRETREELTITARGVESGGVYTLSAPLRDAIETEGSATLWLDLLPDLEASEIARRLAAAPAKQSLSNRLRKALNLTGVKAALLFECADRAALKQPEDAAKAIKALPMRLTGTAPLDEAISTAGGVAWDALDTNFMLTGKPGHFCAGEMIAWDAPTGGYLITACMATGRAAGAGVLAWLARERSGVSRQL
ncbi:TIGR03862 family flavoprotein [Henriciella mobilis]|uniref:TIGR03862 family flavoprotein n=1 Tax=Henriciella mobilis TaxID=2305467 RepID=UPI000E66B8B5|nr:TIGR03862 family flavoprotein [Henriciella mobilis]RIJ16174.1 TIGR03862 family flavoprotein [Henriciella mobilis]RIJ22916.1 TIGR03862 family flavoprotein [Henriciella mobilis]